MARRRDLEIVGRVGAQRLELLVGELQEVALRSGQRVGGERLERVGEPLARFVDEAPLVLDAALGGDVAGLGFDAGAIRRRRRARAATRPRRRAPGRARRSSSARPAAAAARARPIDQATTAPSARPTGTRAGAKKRRSSWSCAVHRGATRAQRSTNGRITRSTHSKTSSSVRSDTIADSPMGCSAVCSCDPRTKLDRPMTVGVALLPSRTISR